MPHAAGVSMSVHLSLAARPGARWRGGTLLPLVACLAASAASAQPAPVQPAGHERMLQALAQVAGRTADTNPYQGDAPARQLREQLAAMSPESTDQDLLTGRMQLGAQELRLGNLAEAIEQFTQARALLAQMSGEIPAVVAIESAFQIGLAYFRLGQTQNCVTVQPPDGCILPLTGAGVFTEQDASRQAILHFAEVLRNEPAGTEQYLEAQWLLNIAYMTLGRYPDWMPARMSSRHVRSTRGTGAPVHERRAGPGPRHPRGRRPLGRGGRRRLRQRRVSGHRRLDDGDAGPAPVLQEQPGRHVCRPHGRGRPARSVRRAQSGTGRL